MRLIPPACVKPFVKRQKNDAADTARVIAIVEEPDNSLPADAVVTLKVLVAALTHLEAEIAVRARANEVARPGLVPRQHSTGGKQRLGTTTKMGARSLRRLLIIGANSVIIKRHVHDETQPGTCLAGMLTRRNADAQAADAGAGGAGQQDGTDRLGPDGPGRRLPVSGPGGASRRRSRGRRSERGQGAAWRNGRETGSGDPGRNRVPSSTRP